MTFDLDWKQIIDREGFDFMWEPVDSDDVSHFFRSRFTDRGDQLYGMKPITQSIASFVACQHSRDTFAPGKLGDRMDDFDRELTDLLTPYAEQGHVRYAVRNPNGTDPVSQLPNGDYQLNTTTVAVQLIDLDAGRVLGTRSDYNGQIACGADVISRINYASTPEPTAESERSSSW